MTSSIIMCRAFLRASLAFLLGAQDFQQAQTLVNIKTGNWNIVDRGHNALIGGAGGILVAVQTNTTHTTGPPNNR